jgi:hypothetical protein
VIGRPDKQFWAYRVSCSIRSSRWLLKGSAKAPSRNRRSRAGRTADIHIPHIAAGKSGFLDLRHHMRAIGAGNLQFVTKMSSAGIQQIELFGEFGQNAARKTPLCLHKIS